MANAFIYMFADKTFGIKAFCIFILVTLSLLAGVFESTNTLVSLLIAGVSGLLIFGHFYECINAVKKSENVVELPFLKPKTLLIGIKGGIGVMLLNIATGIVSIFTLYIPALFVALFYPAIISVFSDKYEISSFFKLNRAYLIIKEDFGKYFLTLFILIFYTTLITTAMFFILNALGIKPVDLVTYGNITHNVLSVTLFTALFYTYNLYVFAYLIGDLYRYDRYDTDEEYYI